MAVFTPPPPPTTPLAMVPPLIPDCSLVTVVELTTERAVSDSDSQFRPWMSQPVSSFFQAVAWSASRSVPEARFTPAMAATMAHWVSLLFEEK